MTTITILGGTGYAGTHLVREAAARGHEVISVSRSVPETKVDGVEYVARDLGSDDLDDLIERSDVVIAALSPRGGLDGHLGEVYRAVAESTRLHGRRLFVVGGFSSLRPAPGEPRMIDRPMEPDDRIPAEQMASILREASAMNEVLVWLEAAGGDLAWTFVSPAMEFGAHVPGERTGRYRASADGLILADESGASAIGGADFAIAVLDEIESAAPRAGHLAVAY